MITKRKNSLVFAVILLALGLNAQQKPAVYKMNDLLKRIHNTSDTVYVVNFWATWCKPCVQELSEFEKLNIKSVNTKAKVKVLLVTLDFKEGLDTKVVPFLNNNKYSTECVLLDEVDGNVFINKINPKWSGAIPATYFTKSNKKQEEFIEKKLTFETLEATLGKF
jgi:thiol-disulfide isomerase/thioredoxin